MNGTIKPRTDLKWSSFSVVFFVASIMLLLAVLGKIYFHRAVDVISMAPRIMTVFAPVSAGAVTVQQGIAEFGGKPLPILTLGRYFSVFISLFFIFVVTPVILIFSKKKLNEDKIQGKKSSPSVRIGYVISLAILIIISVVSVTSSIASNSLLSEFKKMNVESKYRDDVTNELSSIAFKVQQYFILPVEEGGGGRSFLKERKPVSLGDLGFEEKTSLGRFILYQQKSDTILYLHFIGNRIGTINASFDPEITHVVEYQMSISPLKYRFEMNH